MRRLSNEAWARNNLRFLFHCCYFCHFGIPRKGPLFFGSCSRFAFVAYILVGLGGIILHIKLITLMFIILVIIFSFPCDTSKVMFLFEVHMVLVSHFPSPICFLSEVSFPIQYLSQRLSFFVLCPLLGLCIWEIQHFWAQNSNTPHLLGEK